MSFVPQTQILLSNGSVKNIEDIQLGDEIISHNNIAKKVLNKYSKQHCGKLIKYSIANSIPIICDNEFYKLKLESKDTLIWRAINANKYSCVFGEAKKEEMLFAPILKNYVSSDISLGQARLLGLFAAEGSFFRENLVFSFGYHEEKTLATTAINLLEKEFNVKASLNLINRKAEISVNNRDLTGLFYKHIGAKSYNKTLSKELVFGNYETKMNFILGWLEGDGSVDKYSGKIVGTTVSKNLANQIIVMLNSLNINNCLYNCGPAKPSKLSDGRIIIGKYDTYRVRIPYNEGILFINKSEKLANKFTKQVKNVKLNRFVEN